VSWSARIIPRTFQLMDGSVVTARTLKGMARLHDLRHGCATFLLAQGVPARAIMDVLGHAEIGVTMNTYAHVLPVLPPGGGRRDR
jgi:integrase